MGGRAAGGRGLSHGGWAGPDQAPAAQAGRRPRSAVPAGGGQPKRQRPGLGPGRDEAVLALRAYCRSQFCDLQMKAMQPDTSSFCPPSISAIFDL